MYKFICITQTSTGKTRKFLCHICHPSPQRTSPQCPCQRQSTSSSPQTGSPADTSAGSALSPSCRRSGRTHCTGRCSHWRWWRGECRTSWRWDWTWSLSQPSAASWSDSGDPGRSLQRWSRSWAWSAAPSSTRCRRICGDWSGSSCRGRRSSEWRPLTGRWSCRFGRAGPIWVTARTQKQRWLQRISKYLTDV